MISILSFLIAGIVVGYFLRKYPFTRFVPRVITYLIFLLLFFLGLSVGSNEQVVKRFPFIGWDAFLISTAATLGSLLCAWFVYRFFFKSKKNNL